MATSEKVRIVWNGMGGELGSVKLDSVTFTRSLNDDAAIRDALIKLLDGQIVTPGDTFVVEVVS